MGFMQMTDVITIMERTLNHIDTRLVNHGRRVAYIVYQILKTTNRYNDRQLRDICITALLHDIGAYKTEEIDKMVNFETNDTEDHAIYGYLFFKHFSPLEHFADVILHHHTACIDMDRDAPYAELAQILFLADRLDVYYLSGFRTREELYRLMNKQSGKLFFEDIIQLVLDADIDLPVTDEMVMGESEIGLVFHSIPLSDAETLAYLKMIVLFTDFRSHQTLTHTIATTSISNSLAKLMNVEDDLRIMLIAGSWLHDIGKTGVPLQILEKPSKLTPEEMATIQQHVSITDEILRDSVEDEVRHIAAHHHEKMDGSGYPYGLLADEMPISDRIAVVSDIFSALCGVRSYKDAFPKEQVIALLREMKHEGRLDADVVDVAIEHYDDIMEAVRSNVIPFDETFEDINSEYERLQREFDKHQYKE